MAIPNINVTTGLDSFTPAQGKNPLQTVLDLLGSKGGQTLASALGAGMSAYGQNQQATANRQQNAHQFAADLAERQLESDRNANLAQAEGAEKASPLGESQTFAQRQALAKTILGGARNFSATPGDPAVAGAMGNLSGGLRLPQNGLDPQMLEQLFGDNATQASIAQHDKNVSLIDPRAATTNFASLYGNSADGSPNAYQTDVNGFKANELNRQMDEQSRQRAIIQRAIDENYQANSPQAQQQKHGNIFGKILKGVGTGLSFVPGVGQVLAPIASGVGGLVNGEGWKQSLLDAGLSAIPGGAAGKFGKTVAGIAKPLNSPIPKAILGGF